jgi:hypothetical protein
LLRGICRALAASLGPVHGPRGGPLQLMSILHEKKLIAFFDHGVAPCVIRFPFADHQCLP